MQDYTKNDNNETSAKTYNRKVSENHNTLCKITTEKYSHLQILIQKLVGQEYGSHIIIYSTHTHIVFV